MTNHLDTRVRQTLEDRGWFKNPGAYVLVDGQYGSTGKGVAAALLAAYSAATPFAPIDVVTSNAGPNSGHTAILPDGAKWINKQIPIATSVLDYLGYPAPLTYLNGGAVIDMSELLPEWRRLKESARRTVFVHPHAAVVRDEDRENNKSMVQKIASTGKGTGPAAAARMLRTGAVYEHILPLDDVPNVLSPHLFDARNKVTFVETSQGFSLGINSGFYPHCTHRECTVAQALADARISPSELRVVMMVVRTFPIRVGNTQNSSGGCYPDQSETSWEDIGQTPEYTTVTKRVRRVFTWSRIQFREALRVNRPSVVMLNFANYLKKVDLDNLLETIKEDISAEYLTPSKPDILLGFGPSTSDVVVL